MVDAKFGGERGTQKKAEKGSDKARKRTVGVWDCKACCVGVVAAVGLLDPVGVWDCEACCVGVVAAVGLLDPVGVHDDWLEAGVLGLVERAVCCKHAVVDLHGLPVPGLVRVPCRGTALQKGGKSGAQREDKTASASCTDNTPGKQARGISGA